MEIRVLRYFLTVAREESITKAADVLHIMQPTLSRQLSQMEDDLGVKLFHRGTRKITLTNEGMLLRRRAEEILQLVDNTEKELVEQEEEIEGKITIGCGELASWFGDYYVNLHVLFTSNLNTNGAVMVRNGLAYSVVVEGSVPFWDQDKITYRPLSPELTATCVLAWKRQQPFSLAATKFIEHAKCFLGMNKS